MPTLVSYIVHFVLAAGAVTGLSTFGFMACMEEANIPNRWSAIHRWTFGGGGTACVIILGAL